MLPEVKREYRRRTCVVDVAVGSTRQFTVALNTIAKLLPAAREAVRPVIVVPLIEIPKGSLSSAPAASSSSTVVAVAQLVPDRRLADVYVTSAGTLSMATTEVVVPGPRLVTKMQ